RKRPRSKSQSPVRSSLTSPSGKSPPRKVQRSAAPVRHYQSPIVSTNTRYLGGINSIQEKEYEMNQTNATNSVLPDLLRQHHEKSLQLNKTTSKKRQLPRLYDPPRMKCHWDILLDEMRWMASDFAEERQWKRALAWRLARDASDSKTQEKRNQELDKRKLARSVAVQISSFWRAMERIAARYHSRTPTSENHQRTITSLSPKGSALSPRNDIPIQFAWVLQSKDAYNSYVRQQTTSIFAASKSARELMKKQDSSFELNVKLAPFQASALRFMAHMHEAGFNFILNDQMGTGKAFTVSLFLRYLSSSESTPHLVIVPDAEVHKWAFYLKILHGHSRIQVYGGLPLERHRQQRIWDKDFLVDPDSPERTELFCVVCPQSFFFEDSSAFHAMVWQVVVCEDFAPGNIKTEALLSLKNTSRRIIVGEMGLDHWSSDRVALWGEFLLTTEDNKWQYSAWENDLVESTSAQMMMKRLGLSYKDEVSCLQIALRAMTLGRIRNDVEAQLGKVEEQTLGTTLSQSQSNAYNSAVASFCSSSDKTSLEGWLRFFLRLRSICNGVALDFDRLGSVDRMILISCSSKLIALVELIEKIVLKEELKVAIYTQSDAMLPVVEHLMANVLNIPTVRISGTVAGQHRSLAHFAMKDAVKVAILSSRTRTQGTNRAVCVYGAQAIVVLDNEWDQMCESKLRASWQLLATTTDIPVYRLYSENTIEASFLRVGSILSEKLFSEMTPAECIQSNQLKGVDCPHWWAAPSDLVKLMANAEVDEKYCGSTSDGDIYLLEQPLTTGGELELEEHLLLSNNDELTPVEWYAVHLVQSLKEKQSLVRQTASATTDQSKDEAVYGSYENAVLARTIEAWKQEPTNSLVYEKSSDPVHVINEFRTQGLEPQYSTWQPLESVSTISSETPDDVSLMIVYRTKKPPTPSAPVPVTEKRVDVKSVKNKKSKQVSGKLDAPSGSPNIKRKDLSKKNTDYTGHPLPDGGFDDDGFWGDTNLDALDSISWDDASILVDMEQLDVPPAKKAKTAPVSALQRPRKPTADIAREGWSFVEESLLKKLHEVYGSNWNLIAQILTRQVSGKRRSARQCQEKYERLTNVAVKDKEAAKPVKMKPLTMTPAALNARIGLHSCGLLLKYPLGPFGTLPPPPLRKCGASMGLTPPAVVAETDISVFRSTMEAVVLSVKKKLPSPPIPIPLNMEPHKSHLEIVNTSVLSPDEVIKNSKQLAAVTFQCLILMSHGGWSLQKQAEITALIAECTRDLKVDPSCLKTRAIRGHACLKAKQWELAVEDFTAILEVRKDDIHGRFSRGMALFQCGQVERAHEDFSTVLSLNPNHVMARYARAGCYNTEGEFQRAIQDYTIALECDESDKNLAVRSCNRLYLHETAEKVINDKLHRSYRSRDTKASNNELKSEPPAILQKRHSSPTKQVARVTIDLSKPSISKLKLVKRVTITL
ncbi:hypothetical protein THRCLA_02229, partial [Thraustotheca clavata]